MSFFFQNFSTFYDEAEKFTQEVEKHMIAKFSVLELYLTTEGHSFGEFVCHLLGMNQIRCAIQMLRVNLQRSAVNLFSDYVYIYISIIQCVVVHIYLVLL